MAVAVGKQRGRFKGSLKSKPQNRPRLSRTGDRL